MWQDPPVTFDPCRPPVPPDGVLAVGGGLRREPEDFIVEEIPLYEASGEGEWMMILVEKRGLTTPGMVRRIAQRLGVHPRDVGWAGYKDRHALTRQWLTVPGRAWRDDLEDEGYRVLEGARHRNKLKTGHLWGNRFHIRVREPDSTDVEAIRARLEELERIGVPNGYGPQRFGTFQRNHLMGAPLVAGDGDRFLEVLGEEVPGESPLVTDGRRALREGRFEEALRIFPRDFDAERHVARLLAAGETVDKAMRTMPKRARDFLISAWQSACFNRVLETRLADGRILVGGDLAMRLPRGRPFLVENPADELPRAEAMEIVATGPMPGRDAPRPTGEALELESAALSGVVVPDDAPHLARSTYLGTRRALRVPLRDPAIALEDGDLRFSFGLPAGSFATSVLAMFGITDG